jgi:glycosyltransferase involved in cell wall biosynthesis
MATKPLDLELSGSWALPAVSNRYEELRLLLRVFGRPIASVSIPNTAADLDPSRLRRALSASFAPQIWNALAARSLPRSAGHPQRPAISVIVCTRNRADYLEHCLTGLARQDYPGYEVVVVDNAPSDTRTRDLAARFDVRYVVESTPGLDWARNRGLAAARRELVAFIDDDARPDPGWLQAIAAGFTADDVGAVTGYVAPTELTTGAQRLFEDAYGGMGKGFDIKLFSLRDRPLTFNPHVYGVGCNMAFRKRVLESFGGFDPSLDTGTPTGGGGDLDAFQRVVEAGAAIVYRPDAVVRHTHRRTDAELRRQLYDNGRGYCAFYLAALMRSRGMDRLRALRCFARWFFFWHLARIVRRLLRRERLPLRLMLAELRGAIVGPYLYAASRRRARRLAASGE